MEKFRLEQKVLFKGETLLGGHSYGVGINKTPLPALRMTHDMHVCGSGSDATALGFNSLLAILTIL